MSFLLCCSVDIVAPTSTVQTENLAEDTLESLTLKIADIDREARRLALGMSDDVNRAVLASVQGTKIGGGVYAQLREHPANCPTTADVKLVKALAAKVKGDEARKHQDLYGMLLRKERLVARARTDIRYKAIMDIWLFFHVPISVALLAALVAHIVAVFFYW